MKFVVCSPHWLLLQILATRTVVVLYPAFLPFLVHFNQLGALHVLNLINQVPLRLQVISLSLLLEASHLFQVDGALLFVRKLFLLLLESPLELLVVRVQVVVERCNFLWTELYPVQFLQKHLGRNLSFFHYCINQVLVEWEFLENVEVFNPLLVDGWLRKPDFLVAFEHNLVPNWCRILNYFWQNWTLRHNRLFLVLKRGGISKCSFDISLIVLRHNSWHIDRVTAVCQQTTRPSTLYQSKSRLAIAPWQILLLLHQLFDKLVTTKSISCLQLAGYLTFLHHTEGSVAASWCISNAVLWLRTLVRKTTRRRGVFRY